MMRDMSGLVSISLLACWVSFISSMEGGGYIIANSDTLKRLLWSERSKEISSFKISGRGSGSVLVASMVQ